jgi:hypothetical protein
LSLKTTDGGGGNPESPGYLGGLFTVLPSAGDQQGAIDPSHAQARDVLDQKLLNFHILRKAVVDDDRGDLVDPQQAAG